MRPFAVPPASPAVGGDGVRHAAVPREEGGARPLRRSRRPAKRDGRIRQPSSTARDVPAPASTTPNEHRTAAANRRTRPPWPRPTGRAGGRSDCESFVSQSPSAGYEAGAQKSSFSKVFLLIYGAPRKGRQIYSGDPSRSGRREIAVATSKRNFRVQHI